MTQELAPLALWLTPLLIALIGGLLGGMIRYFLSHMVASMARIEGRVENVCRELRENYVTRSECAAHRASLGRRS